jgi:hypothetical protein
MGRKDKNDPPEAEKANEDGSVEVEVTKTERRVKMKAPHADITSVSVEGDELELDDEGFVYARADQVPHLKALGFHFKPIPKA